MWWQTALARAGCTAQQLAPLLQGVHRPGRKTLLQLPPVLGAGPRCCCRLLLLLLLLHSCCAAALQGGQRAWQRSCGPKGLPRRCSEANAQVRHRPDTLQVGQRARNCGCALDCSLVCSLIKRPHHACSEPASDLHQAPNRTPSAVPDHTFISAVTMM